MKLLGIVIHPKTKKEPIFCPAIWELRHINSCSSKMYCTCTCIAVSHLPITPSSVFLWQSRAELLQGKWEHSKQMFILYISAYFRYVFISLCSSWIKISTSRILCWVEQLSDASMSSFKGLRACIINLSEFICLIQPG